MKLFLKRFGSCVWGLTIECSLWSSSKQILSWIWLAPSSDQSCDPGVCFTGGQIAGSLAVVTDAAHVLVDLSSFLISLFSLWLTSKPPTKQLTFGWHRAGSKRVILWTCGMGKGSWHSQGLENVLMSNTGLQAFRDSALMLPQLSGHKTE